MHLHQLKLAELLSDFDQLIHLLLHDLVVFSLKHISDLVLALIEPLQAVYALLAAQLVSKLPLLLLVDSFQFLALLVCLLGPSNRY